MLVTSGTTRVGVSPSTSLLWPEQPYRADLDILVAGCGTWQAAKRGPSLNDLGRVAFAADLRVDPAVFVTTQGVFTGPDPVADKVLQAGNLIEGVPVTSIVSCSEALNNLGQIVMTVQSENPDTGDIRTFVVKATPRELPDND